MNRKREGLCIGGPEDGEWYAVESDRFCVSVREELPAFDPGSEAPNEPVPYNEVWYFEREFRFLEGPVTLFTTEDISARQALLMLVAAYEKQAKDDGD